MEERPTTSYEYDALGQLTRVNDPHENATWVYEYDRGGNILRKLKYAYATGALGQPQQVIVYRYECSSWKDKLTMYNGVPITYDAIGNPLNDGERVYTWEAGRRLRKIEMPAQANVEIINGADAAGDTVLQIERRDTLTLSARVSRGERDITGELAANQFVWKKRRDASAAWTQVGTGTELALNQADIDANMQYQCTFTDTTASYGTVNVDSNLEASHTRGTADANDTLTLEDGVLTVAGSNAAHYHLEGNELKVTAGAGGTIVSTAIFTRRATPRVITFEYNHNGLRTKKTVEEGGVTTIYEYTLHGKLITHMTKRVVDLDGVETTEELHFFYEEQSVPTFVEYNNTKYHYIHNAHGDVVGIVDANGNLVVEYKYDAWGKLLSVTGSQSETLGKQNPILYRCYVYDEESGLYYLRSRYYNPKQQRFINPDVIIDDEPELLVSNLYTYCLNAPVNNADDEGTWSLPNWAKVAIGTALIIGAAVVATVATGGVACFAAGAAIGAAKGALTGAVGGAVAGAIENRIETGSWEGSLEAVVDGAADGYMAGAIGGFITGGITSNACFIAGTLVHAECGLVPIEEIKADQLVWAEEPETGERALKRVVRTFLNEKDELVHIQVNGETITCTTEHPFYVQGKGWVAAKGLKLNDRLELQNGKDAFVDAIRREKLTEPIQVFNFEVEDFHTYYVGNGCVLVHNACKNPGRSGKQARLRELANDDKLSSALRGEIKRDMNAIARGTRKTIRVPKGYELSHRIGYEAKKGYSYLCSDLNTVSQHRLHHTYFR